MNIPSRLFISVGEASGDTYGAELLTRLRANGVDPRVEAIGGRRMQGLNVELVADCSKWGALGMIEAARVSPRVIRGYFRAKRALSKGQPGLFLPIDFGYANIKLARFAKSQGWKVLYFIPPGSWRRDKQGGDLPVVTDEIVTPFSWSAEILTAMGASAHWFGHPLKEMVATAPASERLPQRMAALPGSRSHEVKFNLPVIAESLPKGLDSVEFAIAPSVDPAYLKREWERLRPDVQGVFTQSDAYGVLRRSQAAIVCSGTATLEAALCRCPCVVIYRASKLMEVEYRIRKPKFDFFALPNILLQKQVLPELLQHDASPERIRRELEAIWSEGPGRQAQLDAFSELDEMLGPDDALSRTAELAARMLSS